MPGAVRHETPEGADTERIGAIDMLESDLTESNLADSNLTEPNLSGSRRPSVDATSRNGTNPIPVPASGGAIDSVLFGTGFAVIAGPCAIESASQFDRIARDVLDAGAAMLRGGVYKLRTSPDSFQGLGEAAFEAVRDVRTRYGAPVVSEVVDPRHIASMHDVVDMFQIGTRNMFNYNLLKEVGRAGKPVMLKRAFAARIDEWLRAADYIVAEGNEKIVLCERGIRTFETATRNTLDIAAVPLLKRRCPFPVIVDPSHATGDRSLVEPLCLAAAAAGADGVLVEVHHDPERAQSDPEQSLDLPGFRALMARLATLLAAIGRPLLASERSAADAS